jgi:adenine-specific DNA-methyltransferase
LDVKIKQILRLVENTMFDQPDDFDLSSGNIAENKINDLLRLFPEIRTEDSKIDFEKLKVVLGESIDIGKERFGMIWPGKSDCYKLIQNPSTGTLLPYPEESVNFNTSENLIIEGDNLEVLKLLQKAYLGKIKLIYIDPPYNTGNDFIYPDKYSENLQTYLEYTGQVDSKGKKFSNNTQENGRFHSNWMNMMYPRLYLARNLLQGDGVIFISIDDHEVANLRMLMDMIFGEENFIAQFIWKSRQNKDNRNVTGVSIDHEYVLAYGHRLRGADRKTNQYSNPDNDPRGPWVSANMVGLLSEDKRPNCHYDLTDPVSGIVYPKPRLGWRYDRKTMDKLIKEGRIIWPPEPIGRPRRKVFLSELKDEYTGYSSIIASDIYTKNGTEEIEAIFSERVIEFPKPVELLKEIIKQSTNDPNSIVLDFFAGSGSIAQAVLDLNRQDDFNRKFILVQLPEPTRIQKDDGTWVESIASKNGYSTITEITKERVRRVINAINNEEKEHLPFNNKQDRGFRVFKLAESNFLSWDAIHSRNATTLAQQLELHIDHIRDSRSQNDILYEILLKSGFTLSTKVESLILAGKQVFSVATGALLICLEKDLTMEVIHAIADQKPERVVCLDVGFAGNDQLKVNTVQFFKTCGITSFKTV